jgi:hypothetical protein
MAILLEEEVDIKKIEKRFIEIKSGYHEIDVGYPDINKEWDFKENKLIHPQDLNLITKQIMENYKEMNYDLILIMTPTRLNKGIDRFFGCFSTCYNLI